MRLIRLVTLPYVRRHGLRAALTVAGVALGVAVLVGIRIANAAVVDGFARTVTAVAGRAQLQVSAGDAGVPEEVLDRIRALTAVRTASPAIEAVAQTSLPGEGSLLILAVDLVGDTAVRDYDVDVQDAEDVDPLVFLAQPDSLIVSRDFATRNGLRIGDRLPMQTMIGPRTFTVRGLIRPGGMATAFGGAIGIMDIYAAQRMFGRGRTFDRIDVITSDDATVEAARNALHGELGPAYTVETPEGRGQTLGVLLSGLVAVGSLTSLIALLIGTFVIFTTFSTAVTERRRDIGILRALGATSAQIRNLFLIEGALAGTAGALAGIAAGWGAALAVGEGVGRAAASLTGIAQPPADVGLSMEVVLLGLGGGLLSSVVAAWLPARYAAQLDPVRAIQTGALYHAPPGMRRARTVAAVVLSAAAVAGLRSTDGLVFLAGYALLVGAAILAAPVACTLLSALWRPLIVRAFPVEGRLAIDSLSSAPRRTSTTVAAVMLSTAMTIGLAGVAGGVIDSIREWISTAFTADLMVSTSESLGDRNYRLPATIAGELMQLDGVRTVQSVRSLRAPFDGTPIVIVGMEMEKAARLNRRRPVAGDFDAMHRLAREGRGVIVSENLLHLRRLRLGDVLAIPAPAGTLRAPIVGVLRDYSSQTGAIYVDLEVLRQYWDDASTDLVHVYLTPGTDVTAMRATILERFGGQQRLFVLRNREVREFVLRITEQWFSLTRVQVAIAILVAVLGIGTALTVAIIDRKRELGIFRAVGGTRGQLRRVLWMEALLLAGMGWALGLAFGALNLYVQLEAAERTTIATPIPFRFPVGVALGLLPILLASAWAAAAAPTETAVRRAPIEALESE